MAVNPSLVEEGPAYETFGVDDSKKATSSGNMNKKDENKTFLKVAGGIALLGVIVLVIVLPIYFEVIVPNSNNSNSGPSEPQVQEKDRFDCYPEGGATEEKCLERGCSWADEKEQQDSPSCFYSDNDGYELVGDQVDTDTGFTAAMRRKTSAASPYGEEFENLKLTAMRMTSGILRIKIEPDDPVKRYEVPWEHQEPDSSLSPDDALYDVSLAKTPGGLSGVRVTRKSSGRVLFDTTVGRMMFADQFLQISTLLPSEYVYGFGEHMHETFKHDLNWKSHGMFSRDQGVGPGINLYGVHPYYTCMEGDGHGHGVFFLNSNAQDVTLQPMPALTYRTVGGLFDIYLFLGPEPETIVDQYTSVVGRPYMPPFWALGFQLCRYGYGSLDKLKKVVDRMLATEMPYDVQYSDIDYMDRQLDFTINATTYSGLEDFSRDLQSTHKMKYIIILDPAISGNETAGSYPPFDLGADRGVFMADAQEKIAWGKVWPDLPGIYINTSWDWETQTETFRAWTAFPDFFKDVTKQWWTELVVDFYKRIEFDGLWIDMNEPASFVHGSPSGTCPDTKWDNPLPYFPKIGGDGKLYDKTTCMGNLHHHPVTGQDDVHYNMHSLYGWSQSQPTVESCREATGERCMVISRSTYPGSGKYVGHWLGDNTSIWSHLSASIIGMLEFNLFGIPYIGADICGFFEDTTEELCMRWMQLGAFYPFNRNHNGLGFKDQDPAAFGEKFVTASKKILEVRYSILPYFYTLFYDAHVSGSTVVRSLMAEFPFDLNTYDKDRQMLLGGELLITPVLEEGADSVDGYVPDARWYDFYTGAELAHGLRNTTTSFPAPWDHIPLHIRGGKIIPTQTPARTTELQRANGLGVLYAMGDATSSGHLFWDDGNSIDTIEQGAYVMVNFAGTKDSISMSVEHNGYPDAASMTFDHVTVMGVASDEIVRVIANGMTHTEYTFDTNTKTLRITGLNLPLTSDWSLAWDTNEYAERFDCLPETKVEMNREEECIRRDCLWDEVVVPGVPSCFYPPDYGMYKKDTAPAVNPDAPSSEYLFLERWNRPTTYNAPVQRLKVTVEMQSEHQLRVKITSSEDTRYEVPLTMSGVDGERPEDPLYEVIYQDEPFAFKVVRRSTREVIMDTSVGALIFEEQFLQISSRTASNYMFGLGEAEHANYLLDFDWTTQAMFSNGDRVEQNANLYGHHPYHVTMEKSGNAHGILLLNSNAMEIALTPLPAVTYRTIGGVLDFYIFMGPTLEQVVQQYSTAVGLPMMPPYWALGFQLCKYDYGGMENLKTVVTEMRNYQIPYDVQYGDIDYMERQLDFTVDDQAYPDLKGFVDELRNDFNMRYVIILDPAISANETNYPAYDRGVDKDVFVKTSDGEILFAHVWPGIENSTKLEPGVDGRAHAAFPDFFKSSTSDWWNEEVVDFYNNQLKFDGLWIDMNEPDSFVDGQLNGGGCPQGSEYDYPPYIPNLRIDKNIFDKTICLSAQHSLEGASDPNHGRHYNLHSLYGWSHAEPTLRACRNATGKRCFVIGRSTFPGAGKYEGHWLGDNESKWPHLRSSIIQMFEFSLFGFSYTGADICGFFEDAEEEMCLRWSQLGAFYPFSRNHAMRGTRRQDPAAWGSDFALAVRDVLNVRYTLLPYLYTLFYLSHTKGSTVVRPLMHEFTSDQQTWGRDTQFLWGPALLISPVLEPGKTSVEAYLPDARWFDYYRQEDIGVRKTTVVLPAPREHINLHIRGGHILPTQEPDVTTHYSRLNGFTLLVALDDNMVATGTLFWDDGETTDLGSKNTFYTSFHCEGNVLENRIVTDGNAYSDTLILTGVVIMGLKDDVTQVLSGMDFLPPGSSYSQDPNTKTLTLSNLNLYMNQEFMLRWEVNQEWGRFDCMPDLMEDPNRVECERRGCLWRSSTTPGVPLCYYSNEKPGYKLNYHSLGDGRDSYRLERLNTSSMYGGEIDYITLEVEYQTDNRLHFKFSDRVSGLWEIPESARVLKSSNTIESNTSNANYNVTVTYNPITIKVTDRDGNVLFDSSVGALHFAEQFLQISTTLPSLNVYGFGEHNHRRYRHDLNWRRWSMFTRDVAPVDDWNLYGMQTFFMSMLNTNDGKSVGLYLHNTNAMDVLLQPTPALTYRVTGGVLDFYLFMGDSPEAVVQEYHKLVGNPVMPPYWALGFQLSRWDYGSLDRVKEVVNEMRAAEIPFDVQYGDIDYMEDKKSFTYDQDKYNGLPQFVDQLHDWGMRYIIILDPGIKIEPGYSSYDTGISHDIFIKTPQGQNLVTEVWPGETHHPDYTHSNALEWWEQECRDFYDCCVKFDALWIDMNEPANFQPDDPVKLMAMNCTGKYNNELPYKPRTLGYQIGLHDKSICMDNQQEMGLHYNVHSLYGHTMSVVTFDTLQNMFPTKRSLVLTRSNFAGTGKYAQHWLGDNQSLWPQMAWAIPAMFEFNLFGFPFIGADVCGFYFNTTAEMCQRWMQVGAFYPFSRNHNAADMIPQHPTAFGPEVVESSKKALNIRYTILPYMYTLFYHVNTNGGTLVRALVHEFPDDKQTWNQDRQFLLGPAFLVTPVLDQDTVKVTAYFPPASRWFDYHTGAEQTVVGKFVHLDAPMDHINLHVRGGYILPMQKPNVTTTLSRKQPLSLLVALDANEAAHGDMYWDDGEARDVNESYYTHLFHCENNELMIMVSHSAMDLNEEDNLYFEAVTVLGLRQQPAEVLLNGVIMADFNFNTETSVLSVENLPIDISSNATIKWEF